MRPSDPTEDGHTPGAWSGRAARALVALATVSVLGTAPVEASSPARLELRVASSTLRVGESTRLAVTFLDRAYRPVPNDRTRTVTLVQRGLDGSEAGELSPARFIVSNGAASFADVVYTAKRPGRVVIRAASEGLAPSEVVVAIVSRGASFLSSLFPTVHADPPLALEIVPRVSPPLPANGVSRAKLYVVLDRAVSAGHRLVAHLTTTPPVKVLYGGVETHGFTEITIPEKEAVSKEIQILSAQVGRVSVTARALSGGPRAEARVDFEGPRPAGIAFAFEQERPALRPYASILPVRVHLVDQDGAQIASLDRPHPIECVSATDADVATFEPAVVGLGPSRPAARTRLRLSGVPRLREIGLVAKDRDGDLEPGEATVAVESSVHGIQLIGPARVQSGGSGYPVTVRLVDASGTLQAADWDREIKLSATSGRFEPARVLVPKDREEAMVTYYSPDSLGADTLRADGRLLAAGERQVEVVASATVLFLFAALGGVLGGAARYVYKVQSLALLPRRVKGRLEPGLLGNGLFSALVGIVAFQAGQFGAHNPGWDVKGIPDSGAFGFFLGVLGGFAGVLALDRFVEFFLPAPRETASASPPPDVVTGG